MEFNEDDGSIIFDIFMTYWKGKLTQTSGGVLCNFTKNERSSGVERQISKTLHPTFYTFAGENCAIKG